MHTARPRRVSTALLLITLLFGLLAATPAQAAPNGKTAICHATSSAKKPFVVINVSNNALAAHMRHGDFPVPASGECSAPTTDVCPNIPGDQTEVPPGFVIDPDGNCIEVPIEPCNTLTTAGGEGVTTTAHELGTTGPTSFLFSWEAFFQPDQFEVFYEGVLIYDTGLVGDNINEGTGSATITVPAGTSTSIVVVVTGPEEGTLWEYTVSCPGT